MSWTVVLQAAAFAVLFTQAKIFEKPRGFGPRLWRELAICALCFGVWTGMMGAALVVYRSRPPLLEGAWYVLSTGALSGCLAWVFVAVMDRLEGAE